MTMFFILLFSQKPNVPWHFEYSTEYETQRLETTSATYERIAVDDDCGGPGISCGGLGIILPL